MQTVSDRLSLQTERIAVLAAQAEQLASAGSLQALGSAYLARGETYVALGDDESSSDDFREAAALYAAVVGRWNQRDFLDRMMAAGESHRAALERLGRSEERNVHLLGESQLLTRFGAPLEAARKIEDLAKTLRERLHNDRDSLSTTVQANILLSGSYMSAGKTEQALDVSSALVETLSSCGEHEEVAAVRMARAMALHGAGRIDDAIAEATVALDDLEASAEADPGRIPVLIEALQAQASFFEEIGRFEEMAESLDRCLELAADDDGVSAEEFVALLRRHAQAAVKADDLDGAWNSIDSACDILADVAESEGTSEAHQALNMAIYERARICHRADRYDLALEDAEDLVASWSALADGAPDRLELRHLCLMGLDLRERTLSELGRHEEALRDQTAIVAGFQYLLKQGAPPHVAQGLMVTLSRRVDNLRHLGRMAEAEQDQMMLQTIASKMRR